MTNIEIGIIGGSGLYDMADLSNVEEIAVDTPFGAPSDTITIGTVHGRRIAFLPRHGRGHLLTPTEVPYKANIYALKSLGVKYIVSVSACGSLREDYAPGHIVIPDQLVDFTKKRDMSFFGDGLVAHVSIPEPFSTEMNTAIATASKKAGGIVHEAGNFITIEGPRFSTKGESNLFRQWGMSIIGMTTSPEAFLAAEAEIAYGVMAHVTDYDVWHENEGPVSVELVIRTLQKNTTIAQRAISHLVQDYDQWAGEFTAHNNLKDALITNPKLIPEETKTKLALITAKYWS